MLACLLTCFFNLLCEVSVVTIMINFSFALLLANAWVVMCEFHQMYCRRIRSNARDVPWEYCLGPVNRWLQVNVTGRSRVYKFGRLVCSANVVAAAVGFWVAVAGTFVLEVAALWRWDLAPILSVPFAACWLGGGVMFLTFMACFLRTTLYGGYDHHFQWVILMIDRYKARHSAQS